MNCGSESDPGIWAGDGPDPDRRRSALSPAHSKQIERAPASSAAAMDERSQRIRAALQAAVHVPANRRGCPTAAAKAEFSSRKPNTALVQAVNRLNPYGIEEGYVCLERKFPKKFAIAPDA